MFFDRAKVVRAVDRAKRQSLSKAGAFIRRSAKSSIRKRKRISAPGSPPSSHEGSLRRLIYFGYDRQTDSVVVGPVGYKNSRVPSVLETGGSTVVIRRVGGRLVRTKVKIAARPYMRPAYEKNKDLLPAQFRNSVRAA